MKKEEILKSIDLRQSIFDSRRNQTMLDGIRQYIKRNNEHYSLEEIFEFNATILGAFQLYHGNSKTLKN